MKVFSLYLLLFLFVYSASAQITITSDDLIDVGDSVTLAVADTTPAGFNPGPPGANLHWDFSNIIMDTTSKLKFLDPAGTPYGASFPSSNIAVMGLADFLIEGAWAYATKNAFVFQVDGLAGSYDIFEDIVVPLDPPEIMFSFPINYLDSYSQSSTADIAIESPEPPADSVRLKVVTSVETTVDAWGELTTPEWTGQVLRIRDVRTTIDSVWVKLLFFWVYLESSTNVGITYKYMANDLGYPVMQFMADSSDTQYSGVNYLKDVGVGISDVDREEGFNDLVVYPNPATSEAHINIRYSIPDTRYSLLIYDLLGGMQDEILAPQGKNQISIDVSAFNAGVYVAVLKNEKEIIGRTKFVVK